MANEMSKREKFELALGYVAENEILVEFFNKEIASLDAKAEKAKARAAEKKAAGNEFYSEVVALVGAEAVTRDAVLEAYGDETGEVTIGKIQAALNWGVKYGYLGKDKAKFEGKEKTVYFAVEAAE